MPMDLTLQSLDICKTLNVAIIKLLFATKFKKELGNKTAVLAKKSLMKLPILDT
jgi:hypothetical protein